jgi:hypothetical protein
VQVPRGIALPFSLQQDFLQSSWQIQQAIGKLKMALELDAKAVPALCVEIQRLIRGTRLATDFATRSTPKSRVIWLECVTL